MMFNDRRVKLSSPEKDTYGEKLPGGLKPRTMQGWTDRANVLAAAKAGSIKATSKPKKEPSKLSKKIGGMMMGTGSSNANTVKANRAAIDAELKKGK